MANKEINIFEFASRKKLRFSSSKGDLNIEQLWDLPLQSTGGSDLDTIAKGINTQLKAEAEESFVATAASNPARAGLELKLEVLKHIIGVKQSEAAERVGKAEKSAKRAKLVALLGRQQDIAFEAMTPDQILKELDALDD